MNTRPQTIQIFLPGGDPSGIRIAEITTRIVQVIEVPRSLLVDFLKMDESAQVALYLLFSAEENGSNPKVYIGQTGDLRARLTSHNKEKDFWQKALVLISRTNSLTQTHALFLEWHSLQTARSAGRYTDETATAEVSPTHLRLYKPTAWRSSSTGQTLLATLGYPVFDPVAKSISSSTPQEYFYCKAVGTDGKGLYTSEGFVVLKGSRGRRQDFYTAVRPQTSPFEKNY